MNLFTVASLLVFMLCLSLSTFSFFIGSKKIYILVGLFNLAVSIWGIGCFLVGFWYKEDLSLFGWRIAHFGGYFIPVLFYHIVSVFCKLQRSRILICGYLQSVFFAVITLSSSRIFFTTKEVYGIIYFSPSIWYVFAFLLYLLFTIISFAEICYFYFFQSNGLERRQTLYMLVGFAFGFLGGTSLLLPAFNIKFIYPFGNLGICIYALILTTALIRFRLFDIDAIVEGIQEARLIRLGLLMASINHEVKNPLYVTKELLEAEIEKNPGTPSLSVIKKATGQVERALHVIGKMGHSLGNRKHTKASVCISLCASITSIIDLLSHEFRYKNIVVHNEIKNDSEIYFEQHCFEEVLLNIFLNAIQAMPQGGKLSMRAENDDNGVKLCIYDTGIGISSSVTKNIFSPFCSSKGKEGTGLGLYITKQIVESYDGKISFKSVSNEGTCFVLDLKKSGHFPDYR